jgi:ureidoglycolate hydrolase
VRTPEPLVASPLTIDGFAAYGQIIAPQFDGVAFDGAREATLELSAGTPRLYVMRLARNGVRFGSITRHRVVTQCLGALGGKDWFLAVAPPDENSSTPELAQMRAFHIPGDVLVKLHVGTWHSGPWISHDYADFVNLELVDTNQVDHDTVPLPHHYEILG